MKQQWSLTESAYLVAALHFAKHGSADVVFGLLLGKGRDAVEAVPLFHTFVLGPSLLAGLAITAEYAKSKGLEVVGAYSKTVHALQYGLSTISPKLKTEPLGLLFNADQLEKDECMFNARDDKDVSVDLRVNHREAHKSLKELVNSDNYAKLVDLDEHFVDPSKDFLSKQALVTK